MKKYIKQEVSVVHETGKDPVLTVLQEYGIVPITPEHALAMNAKISGNGTAIYYKEIEVADESTEVAEGEKTAE